MKRVILGLAMLLWVSSMGMYCTAEEIQLESYAAILMEAGTGEIVLEKNSHEPLPPASITKIMTLLLIMEALEQEEVTMDDEVVISPWAAHMGGSQIWLEVGEVMSFRDLLKAVAIASANDASVALAEHIYGSEEAFVQVMNERARELGMENTQFFNCTGLPGDTEGEDNRTSVYDVAILCRALLQYPEILEYTSIWIDYIREGESVLNNTNRLIRHVPGVDGLKTGYTGDALFCLAATALRDQVRMIAVVMKAPSSTIRFEETTTLLTKGFGMYKGVHLIRQGEHIMQVPLEKGEAETVQAIARDDIVLAIRRGTQEDFQKTIRYARDLLAPVEEGDLLGELSITLQEDIVARVDLIAQNAVKKAGFRDLCRQLARKFVHRLYRLEKK